MYRRPIVEKILKENPSSLEKARRYAEKHGLGSYKKDTTEADREFDRKWQEKEDAWKRRKSELGWDSSGSNLSVPIVGFHS